MDAAEYKHVVLGLIFLKYISDAFEAQARRARSAEGAGRRPRRPGRVPRRQHLLGAAGGALVAPARRSAKQPTIGKLVDDAMVAIERDNPSLKGVLPKDYARPGLDKQRLGELIDLISNIGLGDAADRSKDMLGRVYEYFLSQFASAEGKKGGEFYTPRCVVRCWSRCSRPTRAASTTPAAAPAACSCSSEKFVEAHGGQHRRHLASTARSPTPPPGGWPR